MHEINDALLQDIYISISGSVYNILLTVNQFNYVMIAQPTNACIEFQWPFLLGIRVTTLVMKDPVEYWEFQPVIKFDSELSSQQPSHDSVLVEFQGGGRWCKWQNVNLHIVSSNNSYSQPYCLQTLDSVYCSHGLQENLFIKNYWN